MTTTNISRLQYVVYQKVFCDSLMWFYELHTAQNLVFSGAAPYVF
jgi:hypothetical protein